MLSAGPMHCLIDICLVSEIPDICNAVGRTNCKIFFLERHVASPVLDMSLLKIWKYCG